MFTQNVRLFSLRQTDISCKRGCHLMVSMSNVSWNFSQKIISWKVKSCNVSWNFSQKIISWKVKSFFIRNFVLLYDKQSNKKV